LPIITLISDRKPDDFYIGILKGQIMSACNFATIVDLGMNIGLHSIPKAAFILKNACKDFPENTVHIIGVASDIRENGYYLLVYAYKQYFLAADNGIFSLVFDKNEIEKIIRINKPNNKDHLVPSVSLFGKTACELILGKMPEDLGENILEYKQLIGVNPVVGNNFILGNIIYTDSYGNAISNITQELFDENRFTKEFKIYGGTTGYFINKISKCYSEVDPGEILALFNSFGLLEIAMNKGEIYKLFNFNSSTKIRVEFF
jgi:S-adenosylmethionine hydrolase